MALRIRLSKFGRTHHPIYRIVVMDSHSPREGKYVDILGTYDPKRKELLDIKPERVKEWLEKGCRAYRQGKKHTQKRKNTLKGGSPMSQLRDVVEITAKSLVDNPNGVNVVEIEGEKTIVIELRVDKGDIGKVIGKQGRIARALRTILSAMGRKTNKRVVLEILE
jgi:ribosomal protein S16